MQVLQHYETPLKNVSVGDVLDAQLQSALKETQIQLTKQEMQKYIQANEQLTANNKEITGLNVELNEKLQVTEKENKQLTSKLEDIQTQFNQFQQEKQCFDSNQQGYHDQILLLEHQLKELESRNQYLQLTNQDYYKHFVCDELSYKKMLKKMKYKCKILIKQYCKLKYQKKLARIEYLAYMEAKNTNFEEQKRQKQLKKQQKDLLKHLPEFKEENEVKDFYKEMKNHLIEKVCTKNDKTADSNSGKQNCKQSTKKTNQMQKSKVQLLLERSNNNLQLSQQQDDNGEQQSVEQLLTLNTQFTEINAKLQMQVQQAEERFDKVEMILKSQQESFQKQKSLLEQENLQLRMFIESYVKKTKLQ